MASQLFVDTIRTNSSSTSLTINQLQRRTLQRIQQRTQWGAYNPQNEWRPLPGSYITITPKRINSVIDYMFDCALGWRGGNAHSISHWRFYVNNVEYHRHSESNDHQEHGHNLKWQIPVSDFGNQLQPITMGYWVRQYNDGPHCVHFNARHYWDGGGNTFYVPVLVRAEEYLPSPL